MKTKSLLAGLFFTAALFSFPLSVAAQGARPVVVDSQTGEALAKASVFDRKGNLIGVCSDMGELPVVIPSAYPITVRCIGYANAVIDHPGVKEIRLSELDMDLPEVVVDSRNKDMLHMVAYVREYSSAASYTDTVLLFREKTIDFMLPAKRSVKYAGWVSPRVLASKSYYRFTDSNGLDSVSNNFLSHFSWSDWVGLFGSVDLPEALCDTRFATDTVYGKYSPSLIWKREEDDVDLYVNVLVEQPNRQFVSSLYDFVGDRVEFTKFILNYTFTDIDSDELFGNNVARMSFNIQSNGRGRDLNRYFHTEGPIYVDTYAEVYIIDREYMSVAEAKQWDKHPLRGEQIGIYAPADAPPLHPAILSMKERIASTDYDELRLGEETDKRLTVMEKFNIRQKNGLLKRLKRLITH